MCFDLQPSPFCESVVGDLLNIDDLMSATKGIDAVCHLGAIGDVYLAFEQPYLAAAVNATGTANLWRRAQERREEGRPTRPRGRSTVRPSTSLSTRSIPATRIIPTMPRSLPASTSR